jgi:ABC-type transport system involved in cytochrome c biogenesis permease subunit
MDSSKLLGITTFIYMFSSVIYLALFIFRIKKIGLLATVVTIIGLLVNTAGIGMRWLESYQMGIGHAPLSNMYESLVFFAWSIVLLYLVVEFIYKNKVIGAFAMPFAFASMAYASLSPEFSDRITPLVPALQSNWLIAHVFTCFIGYAAFAVACGTGIMYLVKLRDKGDSPNSLLATLPSLKVIDDITHKIILFGFIWLSAGIISGAVRNLVPDHLVCLCFCPACPLYKGLGRQTYCLDFNNRFPGGCLHLLRRQLPSFRAP